MECLPPAAGNPRIVSAHDDIRSIYFSSSASAFAPFGPSHERVPKVNHESIETWQYIELSILRTLERVTKDSYYSFGKTQLAKLYPTSGG